MNCPNCGVAVLLGKTVCPNCGVSLASQTSVQSSQPASGNSLFLSSKFSLTNLSKSKRLYILVPVGLIKLVAN